MSEKELIAHFKYLDRLRNSGATNMFAAGNFLKRDRGLSDKEADRVLGLWMETFSDESPEVRAKAASNAKPESEG